MSKKNYTDGNITKKFEENQQPEGWVLGQDPVTKEHIRQQHEQEKEKLKDPEYREQQRLKKRQSIIERFGSWENYCESKRQKREATLINKYGSVENAYSEAQKTYKQTMLERYGVTNNFYLDETQQKRKQTWLENYGVENPNQNKMVREKTKATNLQRYGKTTILATDEGKQKRLDSILCKYGSLENYQTVCQDKMKQCILEKYGCEYYYQTDDFKQKATQTLIQHYGTIENVRIQNQIKYKAVMQQHYGVDNFFASEQFREMMTDEKKLDRMNKSNTTKAKNNSFNKSSDEEVLYKLLLTKFDTTDIVRNYQDPRYCSSVGYMYKCDFYIKSRDIFIELNLHWTHGGRPYLSSDIECQKQLEQWKLKSQHSKFFETAIVTWTRRDVQKYNIAIKNKLNYKVVYNLDEFDIETI